MKKFLLFIFIAISVLSLVIVWSTRNGREEQLQESPSPTLAASPDPTVTVPEDWSILRDEVGDT